jgi:Tfp pilus assembly protein PilV
MTRGQARATPPAQAGFALIEVVISAFIAVLVAAAVLTMFQASARSVADQRHRSQAYAVAQEDQARLRAMKIPSLYKFTQTRPVTVDGIAYSVESTGKYINDTTGDDLTCGSGSSTVDYVKISSKVTWPSMGATPATRIQSLVAPPSGTLDPSKGTLVFTSSNGAVPPVPISGIGVSGSGAGVFNGSTNTAGCAVFLEQAAGEYTLSITGVGVGLVDQDGNLPGTKKIKVSPEVTNTVPLFYNKPGSVPLKFTTKKYSSSSVSAKTDTFIAFNTSMTTAKLFGTSGGTTFSSKTATPLFPFSSKDVFYAGACTANNPESGEALASVLVPANGTAAEQTILMPSLWLTVKKSGTVYSGAEVVVTDTECQSGSQNIERNYITNASGRLDEPALPWGTYDVCASLPIKVGSTTRNYYELKEDFDVQNVNGNALELPITSSDPVGTCP